MKKHIFFYIFILIFAFQATASAQDYSLFGLKGKVRTATITDEDDETLMEIEFDEDGELTSYNGYLIDIASSYWTRSENTITDEDNYECDNGVESENVLFTYIPTCCDNGDINDENKDDWFGFYGNAEVKSKLVLKNGKLISESISVKGTRLWRIDAEIFESYTFEYNSEGFVKKENFISKWYQSIFNGNMSKHPTTDERKKSSEVYIYTYTEFDKYGNWTKRKNQHGDIETQKITYDEEWLEEQHRANILQEGTAAEVYEIALDRNSPDSIRQAAAARWSELRLDELTASKDIRGLEDYIKNGFPSAEQKDKAKQTWNDVKMEQYKNSEDLYVLENLHNNPLTSEANKKSIRTRWNNLSWQEAAKKKSADFYAYISTSPMAYEEVAKNGWIQLCEMKYRELIDAQTDFTKVDQYRKLAYEVKNRSFNYSGTGKAVFDDAYQKRISEKKETLRQNKINELLKESMQAIDEQRYAKGLNLAKAVLEIDKDNKTAQNLCCKADHG
ncbi:MAG: hypothetical protein IJS43_01210, partial [Bacteroidaceae bacterium]|nr:hypothetical protein [Bacteroidaceae bacterium]